MPNVRFHFRSPHNMGWNWLAMHWICSPFQVELFREHHFIRNRTQQSKWYEWNLSKYLYFTFLSTRILHFRGSIRLLLWICFCQAKPSVPFKCYDGWQPFVRVSCTIVHKTIGKWKRWRTDSFAKRHTYSLSLTLTIQKCHMCLEFDWEMDKGARQCESGKKLGHHISKWKQIAEYTEWMKWCTHSHQKHTRASVRQRNADSKCVKAFERQPLEALQKERKYINRRWNQAKCLTSIFDDMFSGTVILWCESSTRFLHLLSIHLT